MTRMQLLIIGLALLLICGCASTKQARDVKTSGFLGDIYPMMTKGKEDEALLVYRNPKFPDVAKNSRKFLLEPVTIWRGQESQLEGLAQEDLQHLADRFYSAIYLELDKDYEMADQPGPDTIRMQVAFTKLKESRVAADVASKILPVARLVSLASEMATGKWRFVGEASIEVKITEAKTGELMVAAVDRRVGGKDLNADTVNSWGDVYAILDFWAKGMRFKLCQARGDTDCIPPEE